MNQIADYQMKEIINKDKLYKQLQMMRDEQRPKLMSCVNGPYKELKKVKSHQNVMVSKKIETIPADGKW